MLYVNYFITISNQILLNVAHRHYIVSTFFALLAVSLVFCHRISSLASGGQNCHEICHGWICDIWCPSEPGFILGHENRNPERGSQEIHKYIQGKGGTGGVFTEQGRIQVF